MGCLYHAENGKCLVTDRQCQNGVAVPVVVVLVGEGLNKEIVC